MPIAWLDRARFSASNGPIPDSIVEGVEELAADAVLGGFQVDGALEAEPRAAARTKGSLHPWELSV